jgi:Aspartyl protease
MIHRAFRVGALAAFSLASFLPLPSLAATEAGDPAAAALLAKHKAYTGWSIGDGVVKTLIETGHRFRDNKPGTAMTVLRYGVAYRESIARPNGVTSSDGFTGAVFWTSNENGFTVRPVGEIVRFLADEQALFGERVTDEPAKVVKHETVDGVDTVLLRVTPQVGFPMNVWVDPATGAFKRAVIDPDGKYETTFNSLAYTEASGKRFLTTWRYGSSKTTNVFEKVEVNPAINPEDLRPPKQTATWTFGEGTTPVELTKHTFPRILVDVTMNGVKGKFILDTGADGTYVVDSFARKIGAKRLGSTVIGGIAGTANAGIYTFDTIALGPSTLHNVIGLSGVDESWTQEEGVVGLIGFDLFAAAIVELDLDKGTLRIMDPAQVQPNESQGYVVHADLSDLHIRVPMQLNGKYNVIATLDSGNPLNVLFSRDLINRDHLVFFVDPLQLGSERLGGGVGSGTEIEHCGRLDSLSLGPIAYKPVPACDSPTFSRNEILVGLDFMKAFNYVFDYPDGIIVMIPRKM